MFFYRKTSNIIYYYFNSNSCIYLISPLEMTNLKRQHSLNSQIKSKGYENTINSAYIMNTQHSN